MVIMKNENSREKEDYSKDIGNGAFMLEWVLAFVLLLVSLLCIFTFVDLIIGILTESDFNIRWYLVNDSDFANPEIPFLIVLIVSLFEGRKRRHLIKEESFASITNEKLILNFGKKSLSWFNIQAVNLEGQRRLTLIFDEKGKRKKSPLDLKWLSKKHDFVFKIKNYCTAKKISYCETKMTFSSRVKTFLDFFIRYPTV
jgi:hypothetical protein